MSNVQQRFAVLHLSAMYIIATTGYNYNVTTAIGGCMQIIVHIIQ